MSIMTESISEAIKKNLPQQIGEELQKELVELTALRLKVDRQTAQINTDCDKMLELEDQMKKMQAQLALHQVLSDREIAVHERELKQNFKDFEVTQANARREEMLGLVGMVFKSPVYQTQVSGRVPVSVDGMPPGGSNPYGTAGFVQECNVSLTNTKSTL